MYLHDDFAIDTSRRCSYTLDYIYVSINHKNNDNIFVINFKNRIKVTFMPENASVNDDARRNTHTRRKFDDTHTGVSITFAANVIQFHDYGHRERKSVYLYVLLLYIRSAHGVQ